MALEMSTRGSRAYQIVQQQDARGSMNSVPDEDTTNMRRLPPRAFPNPGRARYFALCILSTCLVSAGAIAGLRFMYGFSETDGADTFGAFFMPRSPLLSLPSRVGGLYGHLTGGGTVSCEQVGYAFGNESAATGPFDIDLGRSPKNLSFAKAKLIDVMWDLFVGQGGRFLLAWISHGILMDALTRLMESSPVSYQLYATLVFETTSIFAAWGSLKGLVRSKGWRARVIMAWSAIAIAYVLAFPTLMGAATGYVNPSKTNFRMPDGVLEPLTSSKIVTCFLIADGSRVGLEDGQLVAGVPYDSNSEAPSARYKALDDYVDRYEAYLRKTTSNLRPIDRAPGALRPINSTTWTTNFTTNITIDHRHYAIDGPLDLDVRRCYKNTAIPNDLKPQCVPEESYYVWGFSTMILYITCALQLVWTIGMAAVWLDSNINSELCRKGRKLRGPLRAAVDVSEAVQEVLGDDLCTYSESEIARELKREGNGLRYYVSEPDDDSVAHLGISSSRDSKRDSKFHLKTDVFYGRKGLR